MVWKLFNNYLRRSITVDWCNSLLVLAQWRRHLILSAQGTRISTGEWRKHHVIETTWALRLPCMSKCATAYWTQMSVTIGLVDQMVSLDCWISILTILFHSIKTWNQTSPLNSFLSTMLVSLSHWEELEFAFSAISTRNPVPFAFETGSITVPCQL